MKKRVYLIVLAVVLVIIICVGIVLAVTHKPKNATWDEAKDFLLEQLADYPDIDTMEIWDEDINRNPQEISNIKDKNGNMQTDTVYNFTFRYNEKAPGLEERVAGDFAVSQDLSHIYWYDPANDCNIDINDTPYGQ